MTRTSAEFSTAQVAEACGISFRRLDHWIRKGYVVVEQQANGSGTQRRFSFGEAMQVLLTSKLANIGVRPGTVVQSGMDYGSWPRLATERDPVVIIWRHETLANELKQKLGVDEDA